MLNSLVRALAPTLLCASLVFSQQPAAPPTPPAQEDTVRVSTAVVQLDVIVTDKTGRRVTGLTASDFQVADDGTARPVDYFAAIEGSRLVAQQRPGGPAAGATAAAPAPAGSSLTTPYPARHIALVLDDLNLSTENFTRARRALTDYVNAQLAPNDMVALVSTGGSLASLQQFTTDKQRVLSAISRIAAQSPQSEQRTDRFRITAAEAARIDAGDEGVLDAVARRIQTEGLANSESTGSLARDARAPQLRGGGEEPTGYKSENPNTDPLKAQVRTIARSKVAEIAGQSRRTIQTLASIFKSMAELPGRKIAVVLTESFSLLTNSGEDQNQQIIQLIELARRSGVSIYGLDAGGLRTNASQASEYTTGESLRAADLAGNLNASDFEKLGALRALVTGTGGSLFANTNDIAGGLQRAVEDASSYYVLGFTPAKLDNRFHPVSITVRGKPDLVVRTRRGYLAVNEETVKGTQTELAAALISPIPRMDLPLEVVANTVPQGQGQVVQTGLHVGRNYLQLPAEGAADQTASYEVVAWVFGAGNDKPVGAVSRTVSLDLSKPEERQKLKTAGFVFVPNPFTGLAPGHYQIRAVVREKSSGAVGSSYQFFEVPDVQNKKVVSASSLLLNAPGETGFDGVNSFKPNAEMDARLVVYNPPKDFGELTQRVRLLDGAGAVLLDGPLPLAPAAPGQPTAVQATRLKVPPRRGRYSLVFNLADKKGRVDIERRAEFVVE